MRQVESFRLEREHRRVLGDLAKFYGVSRSEALRRLLDALRTGTPVLDKKTVRRVGIAVQRHGENPQGTWLP